ncbi:MAG: hypothetical protein GKC10_00085 [Methanosarcinales archaeon]|nr:hypothetical protein [Methanosarcinales archaeon]
MISGIIRLCGDGKLPNSENPQDGPSISPERMDGQRGDSYSWTTKTRRWETRETGIEVGKKTVDEECEELAMRRVRMTGDAVGRKTGDERAINR